MLKTCVSGGERSVLTARGECILLTIEPSHRIAQTVNQVESEDHCQLVVYRGQGSETELCWVAEKLRERLRSSKDTPGCQAGVEC